MNRRMVLGLLGLGLVPGVVRRAFGDVSAATTRTTPAAEFDGAAERARQGARPLLILVIPSDETNKYERGRAFGEWLNHGTDEQLRALGEVEVAATSMAEVRRRWPAAGSGEPWMVLVRDNQAQSVDGNIPVSAPQRRGGDDKAEEPIIKRRIAALAELATRAIGSGGRGSADEVRARLVKRPVPGSAWASSSGCGTIVEGDDNPRWAKCGMGHVPELSRRFLYFFTKERP